MGQQDVIKVLQKATKPLTSTEIAEQLEIGMRSVRRALSCLLKDTTINLKFRRLNLQEKKKKYGKVVNPNTIGVYLLKKE